MAYAYKNSLNRHDALDLVQTTYLYAIRSNKTFNRDDKTKEGNLGAWLMAILKNVIREKYVRLSRRPQIDDVPIDDVKRINKAESLDTYDEGQVFNVDYMDRAFSKLKYSDKELIYLTHVMGKTDAEISKMLGRDAVAIRSTRRNAMKRFKVLLEAYSIYENVSIKGKKLDKEIKAR